MYVYTFRHLSMSSFNALTNKKGNSRANVIWKNAKNFGKSYKNVMLDV